MSPWLTLWAFLALVTLLPAAAQAAPRVALLIGNQSYAQGGLRYPGQDVGHIKAALLDIGFQPRDVVVLLDADQKAVKRALSAFGERARGAAMAFLYYSGHATQARGQNWLIPIGAEIRSEADYEIEAVSARGALAMNVNPRDEVLVYFTGHGVHHTRAGSPDCQEGLVTYEGRVLVDAVLLDHLQAISQRAKRVVAMADACHAAGLATKSLDRGLGDDSQPKYYHAELLPDLKDAKAGANGQTVDACAVQVNVPKVLTRDVGSGRILYLGAAADDEAGFTTPDGSLATRAWASCLKTNAHATGRELARCAQEWINRQQPRRQQTITPGLNPDLPWID